MMGRRYRLPSVTASAFCAVLGMSLIANAQPQPEHYPSRPITIVVPFPAGGLTDVPARLAAAMLQEKLGLGVVIENRTGGAGGGGGGHAGRGAPGGDTPFCQFLPRNPKFYYLPGEHHSAGGFLF